MLTSKQITAIVDNPAATGMRGRTAALRRANLSNGTSNLMSSMDTTLTPSQRQLLEAVEQIKPPAREQYVHPEHIASRSPRDAEKPLSASELAWLNRLPTDPTTIPHDDAVRLFRLAHSVKGADDQQLVRSIAAPVREFHDQNLAEVTLRNASAPLTPAPSEALPALADSVLNENPTLQPDEAVGRASTMLQEIGLRRVQAHAVAASAAQQRLDQLNAAAADRVAVIK